MHLSTAKMKGFPGGSVVMNPPGNAVDLGSIPGWGRSPGEGSGNPLQYSCLGNPMDGGAWYTTVQEVAKSPTGLSDFMFFHFQPQFWTRLILLVEWMMEPAMT